jgi:hypothetical protein
LELLLWRRHALLDKRFRPRSGCAAGIVFRYSNPGIHRAAFMLPAFVQANLGRVTDALEGPEGWGVGC